MSKTNKPPTVDDYRAAYEAEMARQIGDIGQIPDSVRERLDRAEQEIVAKLLGFEDKWGTWEVDHCNGRSGNSPAGDALREAARAAVKSWLKDKAGNLPELPKKAIESLRRDYLEALQDSIRQQLVARAHDDAALEVERILGDAKQH